MINDVSASLGKQVSTFNDKIGEIIDINNLEVRFSLSKAQYGRLVEDDLSVIGRPVSIQWTLNVFLEWPLSLHEQSGIEDLGFSQLIQSFD